MSDSNLDKIKELEEQLIARENELAFFRQELEQTNESLLMILSKIKKELKHTRNIQRYLIPTELPAIPGFEFSSKYIAGEKEGGDYFDIFPHNDKSKFGILVSSCSGYLVSALLMSTLLEFTSLIETKNNPNPKDALLKIVKKLKGSLSTGQSVDLFYSVFDRKKFELNYICMGDVIALHQVHTSKEVLPFEVKVPEINSDFNNELTSGTVKLNPRDRLVFLSKGSRLVQGRNHEQYGLARLVQSVVSASSSGAHDLRNKICYDIDKYKIHDRPNRDMTVVIAEVKDKVIKLA